jgi:hypothetical protein
MSSGDRAPIRSYQRIFKPERRIYQVEGHRLPVPGGVPLRWLGYAIGALLAVLLLSSRSLTLALALAAITAVGGLALGGRATAAIAGAGALGGAQVLGWVLGVLGWPMRLVVVPALVATLATQATPDGRATHRFALSWLALQLRPVRRSLTRPLALSGERRVLARRLWVAPDERSHRPRRGLVAGPATVRMARPTTVRRGLRRGRLIATARPRRGGELAETIELAAGETLEVRP